jgi:hypothetical protein
MKSAEIKTTLRLLEAAKRDRKSGYRERLRVCPGVDVVCESQSERTWWEEFSGALARKDGGLRPHDFSFQDVFFHTVKDGREMVEGWDPKHGPQSSRGWQEAAGAVMSSDFSNITGTVIYNRMMEPLTAEDLPFQSTIPTQPTRFNGEKIPGVAGLGDQAEVVPENDDYPLVGIGEDWIETPQTTKRGFIVPITKEAIFFDRTGLVLNQAGKVGDSLRLNKEKRAVDCMIDENTTAHRYKWRGTTYATYQTTSPWDNVTASNALVDWTDIDNLEQTANAIVDPNTGEPVMVEYDTLIVAKSLSLSADRIVNATEISVAVGGYATSGTPTVYKTRNPFGGRFRILTSRLLAARLATDTDYFYGKPSRAFVYMENWPITVTQAPAGNSDDFNRDIVVKFKCSERGQYATLEPRLMGKSTVA